LFKSNIVIIFYSIYYLIVFYKNYLFGKNVLHISSLLCFKHSKYSVCRVDSCLGSRNILSITFLAIELPVPNAKPETTLDAISQAIFVFVGICVGAEGGGAEGGGAEGGGAEGGGAEGGGAEGGGAEGGWM